MMIASSLPNFEIPTGLMTTGLHSLGGFGRGLGAVNVGPLAAAQFSGQLNPQYSAQYWQPNYSSSPEQLPLYLTATQGFTQQLAGLLGGAAVQAAPPGNLNGHTPNVWWVRLPDGSMILPGDLFPPGVILSYDSECSAESALASAISGGQMSRTCAAGGTGLTPTQLAVDQGATPPVTPGGQSTIVGYTPPPATPVQVANPTGAPVSTVAPVSAAPATCSTIAASIQQLQQQGLSNVVIWNLIQEQQPAMLTCPTVQALNPNAYMQSQAATQPGALDSGNTGQAPAAGSTPPAGSSNTGLYIGLAIAAALIFGRK